MDQDSGPSHLARLTYPERHVGASLGDAGPEGFRWLRARVPAGRGRADFRRAADVVASWQVLTGAGIGLDEPLPLMQVGADVVQSVRLGPLRFTAPCVVVLVVDEEHRQGFGYGTVAGHPECGEESFVVELDAQGSVWFTVASFSRPGVWWSRLGGPVTRSVQRRAVARYLQQVARTG